MKGTFPSELALLQAKAGSPLDLARIQSELIRQSLEEVRSLWYTATMELGKLRELLERRTAVLSPTKGFSVQQYSESGEYCRLECRYVLCHTNLLVIAASAAGQGLQPAAVIHDSRSRDDVHLLNDSLLPDTIVNSSPQTPTNTTIEGQVSLLLPPPIAFTKPGKSSNLYKL